MDFTKTKPDSIDVPPKLQTAHRIEGMSLTTERHRKRDLMDLEHHIHSLEIEAYSSVLKAFIAQSDLLTWGKEGLMTDLRKELNVTDVEHGEILIAVNSDESVRRIREQRTLATHAENYVNNPGYATGSVQNSSLIMKTSSPVAYLHQKNMSHCQSSLADIPIPSSVPQKFKDDRKRAELAMFSHGTVEQSTGMINHNVPLPPRGGLVKAKHQLKKGFHTSDFGNIKNRSNLIEMHATNRVILDECGLWLKKASEFLWSSKVEKMLLKGENLDPVVIEKAKSTLREQERAILEALAKLTNGQERHDTST